MSLDLIISSVAMVATALSAWVAIRKQAADQEARIFSKIDEVQEEAEAAQAKLLDRVERALGEMRSSMIAKDRYDADQRYQTHAVEEVAANLGNLSARLNASCAAKGDRRGVFG
jgi:hypothetical protein